MNDEKEMINAINDMLNPYNEDSVEIMAWRMIENGWHKQVEAEWIKRYYMTFSDYTIICSQCNASFSKKSYQQSYNYCPNCGAYMKKPEGVK